MGDHKSKNRDYWNDDRRDDRDDRDDHRHRDHGGNRGHNHDDDHCHDDDHGGTAAKVTAITALSADTGASHSDFITSQALQTVSGRFSGTLKPGELIQVSADGGAQWVNASVSGNNWSASGVNLVSGSGMLITRTIDGQSHALAGASHDYVLDTLAGPPGLLASFTDTGASASDGITRANKTTLSGTAEAGATLRVYDGETLIATVTAARNGTWSLSVKGLANGTHAFTAVQTDIAGNTSAHSLASTMTVDTTVAAPSLSAAFVDSGISASDGITNATAATLSGTAEAGATVKVYDRSTLIGTVTANAVSGVWTFDATGLQDGRHKFSAKQTDLAGNTSKSSDSSAMTVDTTPPSSAPTLVAAFVDTGIDHTDKITSATTAELSGKAGKGALVQIYDGSTLIATVSADKKGAWSYTAVNLPDGAHSFTAAQSDLAGNLSASSAASTMTVAALALPPGVTLLNDTGVSDSDHITHDGTLTLSGVQTSATVEYSVDGGTTWTSSFAAHEGANNVQVRQTDVVGNISSATTLAFTLDTSAAAPGVTLDNDTGIDGDNITSDSALVLNGVEFGAKLEFSTDGGGSWATTFSAHEGVNSVQVRQTDIAGNISNPTTLIFTLDLVGENDTLALNASLITAAYYDTSASDVFDPVTGALTSTDPDAGTTHTFGLSNSSISGALPDYNLAKLGAYGTLYLNSISGDYTFAPDNTAINSLAAGINTSDIFTLSVSDGVGGSASKPLTINLQGANDASVISGVSGPLDYSVGDAPVAVAPLLTLGDVDGTTATSAVVAVSTGFRAGNDTLSFTAQAGITGIYDNQTGILQFTGNAPLTDYEAALASVHFSTTTAGGRVISYTVFDNGVASTTVDTSSISLDVLTTTGFRAPGTSFHDFSGFAVNHAGDINGDGFSDVIIGAPFADGGIGGGASYVIFGKPASFGSEVPLAALGTPGGAAGFRISAQNGYDAFGSSVSGAGDVNGDGYADLIIGAPRAGASDSQTGAAYVIFGHATPFAANLDLHTPLDGSNGFRISGAAAQDWAGYAVSTAGDLNGDGFADLVIGAHYATRANGSYAGAAYVVFGHGGATPFGVNGNLNLSTLNGSNGFKMSTPASAISVNSVSNAGDVNGDGFGDLMVSATLDNGSYYGAPVAYVVFGHATPFGASGNLNLSALNGSTGFSISSGADASRAQHTISSAGDVNGDGFADLIVGMPYADTVNGIQSGAAYVIFGKTGGFSSNIDVSALGPGSGFSITGAGANDWAGYSVSTAGDVNGDGYGDLVVGAPHALGAHASSESYVIFGRASGLLHNIDLSNLSPSDGFRLSGVGLGDASGYAVSAAGDVNGDGFGDLIVGAAYASPHGVESAGESYVVFGSKFIVGSNTYVGSSALHLLTGTAANDHFIAGSSSDTTMFGNGGVDSFSGGAGNDTMHLGVAGSSDSRFLRIEGGSGYDTLELNGSGMALDLTAAGVDGRIHGVERIDLGNSNNSLTLDIRDVLNMSPSSNQLFITGQSGSVSSLGQGWQHAPGDLVTDHGVSYDSYTLGGVAYSQGMANLLIDHNLLVANAAQLS